MSPNVPAASSPGSPAGVPNNTCVLSPVKPRAVCAVLLRSAQSQAEVLEAEVLEVPEVEVLEEEVQ